LLIFFKVDNYYTWNRIAPVALPKHRWGGNFAGNSQILFTEHNTVVNGSLTGINCGSKSINLNQWYFFVYTFSKKDAKCYLNAVSYNSPSFPQEFDTVMPYGGGNRIATNSTCCGTPPYYWRGSIDEVRVYNRALTAAEIKALYEATK
jgi:hypothetical protein